MNDEVLDPVRERINSIESIPQPARQYLGASGVGHPCEANLAFSLRGFPNTEPSPQLLRIFREGHRLEDQVVSDLKKAGYWVQEVDPKTRKQYEYREFGRHVVGHADGQIELDDGEVALLEIKSMNHAKFTSFVNKGVKSSHPMYYWQVMLMMGLSGGKMKKTMLVSYNKNNSDYASEIINFNDTDFAFLKVKIERVLQNKAEKLVDDRRYKTDWRCKSCFKLDTCWNGLAPKVECASCKHASAHPDEHWHCGKHNIQANEPCADYEVYEPWPKT